MGRKGFQTERVIINVTPEQLAAVNAALDIYVARDKRYVRNDRLLRALKDMCEANMIDWPEHVKAPGQRTDLKNR